VDHRAIHVAGAAGAVLTFVTLRDVTKCPSVPLRDPKASWVLPF
jgi:hypothetical protein